MDTKVRTFQETIHIPNDVEFGIDELVDLIDSEIALRRQNKDGEIVKVDSVSIVYGERHYPFVHSGQEFRDSIKTP